MFQLKSEKDKIIKHNSKKQNYTVPQRKIHSTAFLRPYQPSIFKQQPNYHCIQRTVAFKDSPKCRNSGDLNNSPDESFNGFAGQAYTYNVPDAGNKADTARNCADFIGNCLSNISITTDIAWSRNNRGSQLINPFSITCQSTQPQMQIKYKFSHQEPGYITNINFGPANSNNYTLTDKSKNPNGQLLDKQFNTAHDTTEPSKIADIANRPLANINPSDTPAQQQQNIDSNSISVDALAKIGAEGARFQCVRNNLDTLRNNTIFYSDTKQAGVTFSDLWATWDKSFGKKYNISNYDIVSKFDAAGKLRKNSHSNTTNVYTIKNNTAVCLD